MWYKVMENDYKGQREVTLDHEYSEGLCGLDEGEAVMQKSCGGRTVSAESMASAKVLGLERKPV